MHRADGTAWEVVWSLEVNGRIWATGTCGPERLDALAIGRLASEQLLDLGGPVPMPSITGTSVGTHLLRVSVADDLLRDARALAEHRVTAGCGLRHFVHCDPDGLRRRRSLPVPDSARAGAVFRALMGATERGRGGLHTAGLWDGETFGHVVQDVGRHTAVDKVIGAAILAGQSPAAFGLVLTARISGEIALKAARAGVAWVVSRSIPTSLATDIGGAAGLPLVARAATRDTRVYNSSPLESTFDPGSQ